MTPAPATAYNRATFHDPPFPWPRSPDTMPTESIEPSEPSCLVIFDHDGVLADTLALHQDAWMELGRRTGLPVTRSFIRETFGMTNPTIFERLLGEASRDHDLRAYSELKEACYREVARGRIALMDGVRALLDALTLGGARLAIGSSAVRANLDLTVEVCGLEGRFASIAALEDIERGKPDPGVFLLAAARAGSRPEGAAVFEDAPVGIQAAKAAGMYAVGVTTNHPAAALVEAGADEVVETLDGYDAVGLIRRLARRAREG